MNEIEAGSILGRELSHYRGWANALPAEVVIRDDLGDGERIILTERRRQAGA